MQTTELLDELLALFKEKIPQADFLRAYPGRVGSRSFNRPIVTGEIDSETVKPSSEEAGLCFKIFLPNGADAEAAEKIFAAMCKFAGESYPGFSAISRGSVSRDKTTGLLMVVCCLSFVSQCGTASAQGCRVLLGGKEYRVKGYKTAISQTGSNLVSVGEAVPFAVLNGTAEYTVELEGIEVAGLERLAAFTVEIGEASPIIYRGCRWKTLSDVQSKAVFVSADRE